MAVERWSDDNEVGNRLAAHRLTALLSLDLEGSKNIGAIGAVRTDGSTAFTWRGESGGLRAALAALDEFADGATCLAGHNIIEHDLELLSRHAPYLKLLDLPAIDTLYLSPLAYPENPYHHLVKQYQEPALARVQINDPLLDAELTLELLADVADELKSMDGDLLLAWHALLSTGVTGHAFDHFFQLIRAVLPRRLSRTRSRRSRTALRNADARTRQPASLAKRCRIPWRSPICLHGCRRLGATPSSLPMSRRGLNRAHSQPGCAMRTVETGSARGARNVSTPERR